MDAVIVTRAAAGVAALVCLVAIALRLNEILHRPQKRDLSRPRGSRARGILYAFTLGMAPWEKESGRKHWVAYIRGVVFHLGAFAAFALLAASPWLAQLPRAVVWVLAAVAGVGALAGLAGSILRWTGPNERALSVPDDYFAPILVSLFAALACLAALAPGTLPLFYLVSALMLLYIPFGKIRHCIYFFWSKFFFGANMGQRGVMGQPPGGYSGHEGASR